MNRIVARDILNGLDRLRSMGQVSPRSLKRVRAGLRVPHIRADLRALVKLGAVEETGPDRFSIGPRFDELHEAANWDEDDGTPDPGWPI